MDEFRMIPVSFSISAADGKNPYLRSNSYKIDFKYIITLQLKETML